MAGCGLGEYTVGQVAQMLGVSLSALKSWEVKGYIPRGRRITLNKIRIYNLDQIDEIRAFIRGNF